MNQSLLLLQVMDNSSEAPLNITDLLDQPEILEKAYRENNSEFTKVFEAVWPDISPHPVA